jgi:hypothetical protein
LKSWNDFNCDGKAWFNLSKKENEILTTKKIKKIRITNGYSHESFTDDVDIEDEMYFIKLNTMLKNNKIFQFDMN